MKYKSFLAVSLRDFHQNQDGPQTTTLIRFINAPSYEEAELYLNKSYPAEAWFLLPKEYCDRHIVTAKLTGGTDNAEK